MNINPSYLLILATLMPIVSCETVRTDIATTTQSTRIAGASIDANPSNSRSQIGGIKIVSINDKPVDQTKAALSRGLNNVKIQYNSPTGKKQEVDLAFKARPNQPYYVKLAPYPSLGPVVKQPVSEKMLSGDPYISLMMVGPAIAVGLTEPLVSRASLPKRYKAVKHVDVSVISEDISEGVVRTVRVYSDGKIDSKTWDAWSNAPGKS